LAENRKIPLGSPVIIDTINSKYNLNNDSTREIALMPEGVIMSYTNEISGQFLIIKLRSNIEIKVSENELSECTRNYYFNKKNAHTDLLKSIEEFFKQKFIINGNREIKYVLNAFTFLKWLKYTIKDVF
tara:strand:- start:261 stop:647 length:387 start_codon:yes stop_codon:yes gene_type:complete